MASPTYNVLLIEDNPGDARLIREMLAEVRIVTFELQWADRLSVGLERLCADEVDVVLLDLSLPDSQGLDTFNQVYAQAEVPIVILSGLMDERLATKAVQMGAQDYLVKGQVNFPLLAKTIRYAIERRQAQQLLHDSEQRLRLLADSSSDYILMLDAHLNIQFINRAEPGVDKEEMIGTPVYQYVEGHDRGRVKNILEQVVNENKMRRYETTFKRPDGTVVYFETGASPIQRGGKVTGVVLTARDITERKQAEEALRQRENEYRTLAENSQDYIMRYDREHRHIYANVAALRAAGKTAEEFIGKTHREMGFPDHLCLMWEKAITRVFSTGKVHGEIFEWEGVQGNVTLDWRLFPEFDREGKVVSVLGVSRDITERMQAEEALSESEERFRRAVLDSPFPMMLHAEDGEVLQINTVWSELTGYLPEEIPTLSVWTELAYGKHKDAVKGRINKVFDSETRVEEGEYVFTSKAGKTLIWDFSSAPLGKLPDGRRLVISIAKDVTERKEVQKHQLLESKILECLNEKRDIHDVIQETLKLIKESTGFEAVGIRLREGEDFPYFCVEGFPDDFVEKENSLCSRDADGEIIRDRDGQACLNCICGNVLSGRTDASLPFFTEQGSFWTNSTTSLITASSSAEIQDSTRNQCSRSGYESLTLIPLRSGNQIIGLLQLNDSRRGCFTPQIIRFFEDMALSIGIAIARIKAEKEVENLAKFPSEDPNPVMRISRDGSILYANSASDVVLETWNCSVGECIPKLWRRRLENAFKVGEVVGFEFTCHDSRIFSVTLSPVVQGDYANVYGLDITERKRAEEELKWELAVNEALSKLYKPLISPTSTIENVANTILDQARSLTGSEHGYVASIAPETGDVLSHTITAMLQDQCQVSGPQRKIVFPRGADGRYPMLWGHSLNTHEAFFTNTPVTHPASGGIPDGHIVIKCFLSVPVLLGNELVGQIALANKAGGYTQRDLDAIKRMAESYALSIQRIRSYDALQKAREELEQRVRERTLALSRNVDALQQSEARLADAQRMAHLGNWDRDIVKKELWWSNEVYHIFGLSSQEFTVSYEAFLSAIHPDDREFAKKSADAALYDRKPYSIDHRIIHPDGTERIVHEQAEVVYDAQGNPIRMLGTVQDITQRKRTEDELRRYQKQLQSMASELTLAEERQRRSIAEGLHDQVGQLLTAVSMKLEYLEGSEPLENLSQAFGPIYELIQQAIQYTRNLTFELSPPRLYTLGFEAALKWLAEQMDEQYSIRCEFEDDGLPKPMADEIKVLLYRIVRELLHNIAKHSVAREAKISLTRVDNNIQICVEDDGVGFDPSQIESESSSAGGFGLFSVRERLNYLKGNLEIRSGCGRGTQSIVTVPLNPSAE